MAPDSRKGRPCQDDPSESTTTADTTRLDQRTTRLRQTTATGLAVRATADEYASIALERILLQAGAAA